MSSGDYITKKDLIYNDSYEISCKLRESKQLLKEALNFMNLVPNNCVTIKGNIVIEDADWEEVEEGVNVIDHYELCSRIDKFLKED